MKRPSCHLSIGHLKTNLGTAEMNRVSFPRSGAQSSARWISLVAGRGDAFQKLSAESQGNSLVGIGALTLHMCKQDMDEGYRLGRSGDRVEPQSSGAEWVVEDERYLEVWFELSRSMIRCHALGRPGLKQKCFPWPVMLNASITQNRKRGSPE